MGQRHEMGQKRINISKQNEKLDSTKAGPEQEITHSHTRAF